jgi:uncharacterized protein YgbK (DUF1537 family)
MILVIADDITGAAEIGGIGLRYGLRVVVSNKIKRNSNAELLIVYTNTRSMKRAEAISIMEELTREAASLNPSLIYKKTDSVLRGHVLAEMKKQMEVLDLGKALLVPVNPLLGRAIRDGHYYVNDQLINETSFSSDPEFPLHVSRIEEMLGDNRESVKVATLLDDLPGKGIIVGEAQTEEDVLQWAIHKDQSFFLAGGASFFNALIRSTGFREKKKEKQIVEMTEPILLVSGTTFKKNVERLKQHARLVSYLPADEKEFNNWTDRIVSVLSQYNKAIIAIGNDQYPKTDPPVLSEKLSEAVKLVSKKIKIPELLIEGGSTAFSIIKKLGLIDFIPTEEMEQGIVRMKVDGKEDMHLTIKPGSYDWPAEWNFN